MRAKLVIGSGPAPIPRGNLPIQWRTCCCEAHPSPLSWTHLPSSFTLFIPYFTFFPHGVLGGGILLKHPIRSPLAATGPTGADPSFLLLN